MRIAGSASLSAKRPDRMEVPDLGEGGVCTRAGITLATARRNINALARRSPVAALDTAGTGT